MKKYIVEILENIIIFLNGKPWDWIKRWIAYPIATLFKPYIIQSIILLGLNLSLVIVINEFTVQNVGFFFFFILFILTYSFISRLREIKKNKVIDRRFILFDFLYITLIFLIYGMVSFLLFIQAYDINFEPESVGKLGLIYSGFKYLYKIPNGVWFFLLTNHIFIVFSLYIFFIKIIFLEEVKVFFLELLTFSLRLNYIRKIAIISLSVYFIIPGYIWINNSSRWYYTILIWWTCILIGFYYPLIFFFLFFMAISGIETFLFRYFLKKTEFKNFISWLYFNRDMAFLDIYMMRLLKVPLNVGKKGVGIGVGIITGIKSKKEFDAETIVGEKRGIRVFESKKHLLPKNFDIHVKKERECIDSETDKEMLHSAKNLVGTTAKEAKKVATEWFKGGGE